MQDLIERTQLGGGHIPELNILHMFKSLCEAILAFHGLDPPLAHRDIKVGRVCIIDHGLHTRLSYIQLLFISDSATWMAWKYCQFSWIDVRSLSPAFFHVSLTVDWCCTFDLIFPIEIEKAEVNYLSSNTAKWPFLGLEHSLFLSSGVKFTDH